MLLSIGDRTADQQDSLWADGVHPPDENAEFAARHGMSFLCNLPPEPVRQRIAHYGKIAASLDVADTRSPKFAQNFFIVVGDTDAAAMELAKRAYLKWHHSFHYLYHLHGRSPMLGERPTDFEVVMKDGLGIAGTPETVAKYLAPRIAESGINYVVGQFAFGNMSYAEAAGSVELFGREVMPRLRAEAPARHQAGGTN